MNKKTIIVCIVIIAVLLVGVAVAVFFLYSGNDSRQQPDPTADLSDSRCGFFCAVPSDAAAVMYFSSPGSAVSALVSDGASLPLVPDGPFRDFLRSIGGSDKALGPLRSSQVILSCHYVGGMEPLFVMDLCRSGANTPESATLVQEMASKAGIYCRIVDCSQSAASGTYLKGRKILIASTSDVLADSCERHIVKGVSVLDKDYFACALNSVKAEKAFVLLSNDNIGKLVDEVMGREYRAYSDALKRLSDWCAFSIEDSPSGLKAVGRQFCGTGANKLVNIFSEISPSTVSAFSFVPSYAISAFAMPVPNVKKHIEAYNAFANTKSGRVKYAAEQARLKKAAGISPTTWAEALDIKEIAVATFYVGDTLQKVLLIKVGNSSAAAGYFPAEDKAAAAQGDYAYAGFVSSLFGSLFSAGDETGFALMDGWLVVGSGTAVSEYTSGKALENTLARYLAGANLSPDLKNQWFMGYFSLSEDARAVDRAFRPAYAKAVKEAYDSVAYVPALFSLGSVKGQQRMSLRVDRVDFVRSDAPQLERDATVVVENGRFSVKNSGTGKMNTFYQQDNLYLCLNDENGKGLWGVAFKQPICGRAGTVDYFANGKLQILFAAGTKLYLIDRLGRFVQPFPVDLGKEILLGPDIYDFSGQRRYNVMILHKDNTVDMYNLQGKKPADWKGITHSETIMNLPERVDVGGRTFWIVRTSLQTLVYPFYGGEPLTSYKGNDKIRPDSKITPVEGGLKAVNYYGREVTILLK